MRRSHIAPKFVDNIPDHLDEGTLYVSEKYKTAVHLCCCGCRQEVVTPLTPVDWRLTRNGDDVTLYPSIGNWSFKCQSHYWIRRSRIQWSYGMTSQQIGYVQNKDKRDKVKYTEDVNSRKVNPKVTSSVTKEESLQKSEERFSQWLKRMLRELLD